MHQGREVRLHRERLETLSRPWYASLRIDNWYIATALSGIGLIGWILGWFGIGIPDTYVVPVLTITAIGWTLFALARRDRMWRELIRRESPELHRRLTKKDEDT